uniref:Calmodulin n=1 Tax=Coccolithus braarudii TaxID=221442 RepID=A0A7S0LN62_9EUKA
MSPRFSSPGGNNTEGLTTADAARQKMQIKSFTAWVNLHLKTVQMECLNLQTDLADGIMLLKLVEIISEEQLGKYNKNPVSKFQKIENLNIPLKFINSFLTEVGIRNSYSAENILEENLTLILGMIWSLILRYNVAQVSEGDKTAKEGLLLWAKTKIAEVSNGKVEVHNFHNSWQDGIAFNCLIQAYRPDLVDYRKLTASKKITNLNQAFDIAEKHIDIPKLLDANDMVTMRPDEKSVMTYVSFFWKAFAANKRKNMAGERITHVVQREQAYADMQMQYKQQAQEMNEWALAKTTELSEGSSINSQAELEVLLKAYVDYSRTEKTAKQQELLDMEALFSSITSRLATLDREFVPPEELTLAALQKRWAELTQAEQQYEAKLNALLKNLKKVELYIKLFNNKALKLDDWLDDKETWLGQSLRPLQEISSDTEYANQAAVEKKEEEEAAEAAAARRAHPKRPSFIDSIANAILPNRQRQASAPVMGADAVSPSLPRTKSEKMVDNKLPATAERSGSPMPRLLKMASKPKVSSALVEAPDSVSDVQAKLNMFAAYEEEFAGRKGAVPELQKLLDKIIELGCPPMRQFSLQNKMGTIEERFASVEQQGVAYVGMLNEELARQQKMDEMRLTFAKRAEALNRWMEEALENLTEAFAHESVAEAEQQLGEFQAFEPALAEHEAEMSEMEAFAAEMSKMGIVKNAYSRFDLEELQRIMGEVKRCAEERTSQLQEALERQQHIEKQKQAFATAAEAVLEFVRQQKQALEVAAPAIAIREDDPGSLMRGKQMLVALEEHLSSKARDARHAQLQPAQELSDFLLEAAALDNPYTRETLTSLETNVSQLEKVIRDKHSFIEAQLAQAQLQISPEQYDEIKKAHTHFDKSKNGSLQELEFNGALRAMGFEMSEEEEQAQFVKFSAPDEAGEPCLTLDGFVSLVLQQFKASDTMDALISAFKTVAGGKDFIMADDLKACVPESETNYLLSNLELREDVGLNYTSFSADVYGKEAPPSTGSEITDMGTSRRLPAD